VPDCIPLSSCLIDSSNVLTCSKWPEGCGMFSCDWSVSVRAGSRCSRGVARPEPGFQGQFKAVLNIHANTTEHISGSFAISALFCRSYTPLRLISKASCLECDSLLARMNMTTWLCVCSEMSRPLMSTTWSPSMSLGSERPAYIQHIENMTDLLAKSTNRAIFQQ